MTPTPKTPDLRALLREHVPLEPEHELHAQSLALLAEIEAALDEADEKAHRTSTIECSSAITSSGSSRGGTSMTISSQDRPFDTQKIRSLASEITQRRLVTCELSARLFSREFLISSEVRQAVIAFAEVRQKFYAYLASLHDTCDSLIDDHCTLVLIVFSDLLDLSLVYMPWLDQSGRAKDETEKLINELEILLQELESLLQSGPSGEADRLSFLGGLVDGACEGQRDAH